MGKTVFKARSPWCRILADCVKTQRRASSAQDRFAHADFAAGLCRGRSSADSNNARCRYGTEFSHGLLEICTDNIRIEAGKARWQHRLMEIRDAVPEDALAGCTVMKQSIAELCAPDHKNDPAILARWLGNKTVENFVAWINQPDNSLLVAVEDGEILAVGSVTDAGTVGLNYVSPDARFRGVSRAMLRALEARAAERGNIQCTLTSTETARQFYLSNGYVESGAPSGAFGTSSGYPMTKSLIAPSPSS